MKLRDEPTFWCTITIFMGGGQTGWIKWEGDNNERGLKWGGEGSLRTFQKHLEIGSG